RTIIDVALRGKDKMISPAGLDPLQIDQLRDKKLRQTLLDLVVDIDREHTERSWRIIAAVLHLERQIVEKVNAIPPRVKKRPNVAREPDSRKHVHVGFTRGGREIRLGDKHGKV